MTEAEKHLLQLESLDNQTWAFAEDHAPAMEAAVATLDKAARAQGETSPPSSMAPDRFAMHLMLGHLALRRAQAKALEDQS